ncbi:arginine deiminase family protein [Flavobacteriaceae bacterium KMM 6897]|nr:arginine deiminase family protein [Flavobacteriaceae bacterium KMM 6897]MEB8346606.1 arginine deiminase family protein [Flavobacteriaceae bacterium KMM 6898]
MIFTSHSEYNKLDLVLINPVKNAFIGDDKLGLEWRELDYLSKPNFEKAELEYASFESLLKTKGVSLLKLPSDPSVSIDAIYSRDAAIATNFGVILCRMGKARRMPEPKVQEGVYKKHDIHILGEIQTPGTLEGGDVAWLDESTLAVGHSYRTNEEGIQQLKKLLSPFSIEVLVVELPHYKGPSDVFHLMSIFSPVDKDLAVVYSPLLPIHFRKELINRGMDLIEVPEEEFDSMGCNVLAIGPRNCIMVAGNAKTEALLRNAGCEVNTYFGEEISVKGGGGPTCLTRPIRRRL